MAVSTVREVVKYHIKKSTGEIIGTFSGGSGPKGVDIVVVEAEPPGTGKDIYDFATGQWVPYEPPYDAKRKKEYLQKLGDQGDQNDAIYKGVMAVVDLLKTLGVSDVQLNNAGLLPNKNADPGTPAHWLGTIEDIKTKNPKPNK